MPPCVHQNIRHSQVDIIGKCQVEIVDLRATYVGNAKSKSTLMRDGTELCGVEEFAARHFRRSGLASSSSKARRFMCFSACICGS
jgi:hypothetical protein